MPDPQIHVAPNHVVIQRAPEVNMEGGILYQERRVDTLKYLAPYRVLLVGPTVAEQEGYEKGYKKIQPGTTIMLVNSEYRAEVPQAYIPMFTTGDRQIYVVPVSECKLIIENDEIMVNQEEAQTELDASLKKARENQKLGIIR